MQLKVKSRALVLRELRFRPRFRHLQQKLLQLQKQQKHYLKMLNFENSEENSNDDHDDESPKTSEINKQIRIKDRKLILINF